MGAAEPKISYTFISVPIISADHFDGAELHSGNKVNFMRQPKFDCHAGLCAVSANVATEFCLKSEAIRPISTIFTMNINDI